MACAKGLCTLEKLFMFINIAFAMYSGALLCTAARLMWDPSTYAWFRFLCAAQYRVSTAYVFAAGAWLSALVFLAADVAHRPVPHTTCLNVYAGGVLCLAVSEVAYGTWMAVSLVEWWRSSEQAVLARKGMDLLHDLKLALLVVERNQDVARPVHDMIKEVEREAPNNVFVIVAFGAFGVVMQIAAFIMARRLARRVPQPLSTNEKDVAICSTAHECEEDSDSGEGAHHQDSPGWRKKANLRMYTILDKIF